MHYLHSIGHFYEDLDIGMVAVDAGLIRAYMILKMEGGR
jgi:hypothetical protein